MTDHKSKAIALLTAESIIIAFLFGYAPVLSSTIVTLHHQNESIVTTVWAGLAIFTLILTGFRSIYLLFDSIGTDYSVEKYRVGKDLFIAVILGTSVYVVFSVVSILHYALAGRSFDPPTLIRHYAEALSSFDITQVSLLLPVPFLIVWLVPVWFFPLPWLGRRVDCMNRLLQPTRDRLATLRRLLRLGP